MLSIFICVLYLTLAVLIITLSLDLADFLVDVYYDMKRRK